LALSLISTRLHGRKRGKGTKGGHRNRRSNSRCMRICMHCRLCARNMSAWCESRKDMNIRHLFIDGMRCICFVARTLQSMVSFFLAMIAGGIWLSTGRNSVLISTLATSHWIFCLITTRCKVCSGQTASAALWSEFSHSDREDIPPQKSL
jgi:hypothetical protein